MNKLYYIIYNINRNVHTTRFDLNNHRQVVQFKQKFSLRFEYSDVIF